MIFEVRVFGGEEASINADLKLPRLISTQPFLYTVNPLTDMRASQL